MQRISQAKYENGAVTIVYQRSSRAGTWDKNTMSCSDEPARRFLEALLNLAPHVQELMGLPVSSTSDIAALGVTLKYAKHAEEIRGAHISAAIMLPRANAAMKVKVPIQFGLSRSTVGAVHLARVADSILTFIQEADRYLAGGNRAQASLFDDPGATPPSFSAPDDETADDREADVPAPDTEEEREDTAPEPDTQEPPAKLPDPADTYRYLFARPEQEDDQDRKDDAA